MSNNQIDQVVYDSWLTPRDAHDYANTALRSADSSTTLWQMVKNGVVRVAAQSMSSEAKESAPAPVPGPWLVPLDHLPHYFSSGSDFWNGTLRFFVSSRYSSSIMFSYFGVRLDPGALIVNLPKPPPPPDPPVTAPVIAPVPSPLAVLPPVPVLGTKLAGGRPPKAFWEALWIEMACQVWAGEIGPESKQAEIQDAMNEWVTANEHEASPATLKNAARALLQALQAKKGKNP